MAVELSAPPEVPSWEAQLLRVSLFLPSTVEATAEMWTAMAGTPPETEQRRPRELAAKFTGAMAWRGFKADEGYVEIRDF
jgi:hypothetical protein